MGAFKADLDNFSAYDYVVPAHGKQLVLTDIQVELPEGCYGRIAPRSGLAAKNFIDVGGKERWTRELDYEDANTSVAFS